ncbi:amidohydrolase family protein [Pseudomaricurvus alkylphenolicus]|nr:amidohydrolase family protein [Pseudomaricurvus alkylphenolicus]
MAVLGMSLPAWAMTGFEKEKIPPRMEGEGHFQRLVLRGGYLLDGTGAPAQGPVDIVIENDRITEVRNVGRPGVPINPAVRPAKGDREIDVHGKFILPGLINSHAHIHGGNWPSGVSLEYMFKLWLAHGITTVRTVGGSGEDWGIKLREMSNRNEVAAPRFLINPIFDFKAEDSVWPLGAYNTPKEARKRIRDLKKKGADGVKFLGASEEVLFAALDEAEKIGLHTTMHHAQVDVIDANVLDTSARGLDAMEHWYGLPEAMFEDKVIQDYPKNYIYNNEQDRFGQAGRLWKQAAKPGSETWNNTIATLIERDFVLSPTLVIYSPNRDVKRAMRLEWHDEYTTPNLWNFYRPSRYAHASNWFDWTPEDEIEWKNNFKIWMQFLNDYKNKGGKVAIGTDAGYGYITYGFAMVQEMEMMQEAGFHPLEVIRSATKIGAELAGMSKDIGTVEVGKKADLLVVDENPVHNLKVLYGTGTFRLNDDLGRIESIGGVRWTIKDGIVYDAKQLLEDVRQIVRKEKQEAGLDPDRPMPIIDPTQKAVEVH